MKRCVPVGFMLLLVVVFPAVGQVNESIAAVNRDQFLVARPETKLEILRNVEGSGTEQMGPLYVDALEYAVSDPFRLNTDAVTQDIALLAVERITEAGYRPAVSALWRLFTEYGETVGRVAILRSLGSVGAGNAQLLVDLNRWVTSQSELHRGGMVPDEPVMLAAVETLGMLGDDSSFEVLLDAQLTRISRRVSDTARDSMRSLDVDYVERAIRTIRGRTIGNKLRALIFFVDNAGLSDDERVRIAAGALDDGVGLVVRDVYDRASLPLIRYHATRVLKELPYPPAAPALVLSFDQTLQDYELGVVSKAWLLDAVSALGATESETAALRLVSYLELINQYTENDMAYDAQIILSVVENLGRIGSPHASDVLLRAAFFDYPDYVKEAARQAFEILNR